MVAWAGHRIFGQGDQAKAGIAKSRIHDLSAQLGMFKLDTGRYPTAQEGLGALLTNPGVPNWNGPYVRGAEGIKDPWNNDFIYKSPGEVGRPFVLLSLGADGKESGDGPDRDISD